MRSPAVLAVAMIVGLATVAPAQITQNITGTEIFITHDWGNPSVAPCSTVGTTAGTVWWDNIVLQDMAGVMQTIEFNVTTTTSSGTYGVILVDGAYEVESFWATATGLVAGHHHINSLSGAGNPGNYEATHGNGLNNYQGYHIYRTDGQQFQLVSIDYANVVEPFLIGTSFMTIADIPLWIPFGPPEGVTCADPNWNTHTFVVIPPDIDTLLLDESATPLNLDPTTGTFNVSAVVTAYVTVGGILVDDPTLDPVIGATITMSGNFAGTDLTGLTDILLTPSTTTIVAAPGTDELTIVNQLLGTLGAADETYLGGPLGTIPTTIRALGQNGTNTLTRTGAGSTILDILNASFSVQQMQATFALTSVGAKLYSIEKNYMPQPPAPEMAFGTNGAGSAEVGIIGYTPSAEVWNFYALNSVAAQGSGPFFGLDFGPSQVNQFNNPIGTNPLHIQVGLGGGYYWAVPTGTIPAGLTIDLVSVEIPVGSATVGFISSVERVNF